MKHCRRCDLTKPLSDWYFAKGTEKTLSFCKTCCLVAAREYRTKKLAEDPNYRQYQRDRAKRSRSKLGHEHQARTARAALYRRVYGITIEEYERLETAQSGLCAICSTSEKFNRKLAVDHCHATGRVRGLLCGPCNTMLGSFEIMSANETAMAYLAGLTNDNFAVA